MDESSKNTGTGATANNGESLEEECEECDSDTSTTMGERSLERTDRLVHVLRVIVSVLIVVLAVVASTFVYLYTKSVERQRFESEYEANAQRLIESFESTVESKLVGINSMATAFTSFALATGQKFPFVTLPNFALRGSDLRVLSNALIIHYMPLVTDSNRLAWEEYALLNRSQIDDAFDEDNMFRDLQDQLLGMDDDDAALDDNNDNRARTLDEDGNNNLTMLDDGSGFHPRIWSNGAVTTRRDEPTDSGPYLPLWQRSPVSTARQLLLNINWVHTKVFQGALPVMMETGNAVINPAVFPLPQFVAQLEENIALGQYRNSDIQQKVDDPVTFLSYPVFDSFGENKTLAGVIATNLYWSYFFANVLQPSDTGYICLLENSFNQKLSYRVDGGRVTYLGQADFHDSAYDDLEAFVGINEFVEERRRAETRSYTTVSLNDSFGAYTLKIYPTSETEEHFTTSAPIIYTVITAVATTVTAAIFFAFTCTVEKRQRLVMGKAVRAAENKAKTERQMNEFLSHEVRNPLSAALIALSNAKADVKESSLVANTSFKEGLEEDFETMASSLHFIDDFLRSVLDIYRASANKLIMNLAPVDIEKDIFDPVCSILQQRNGRIQIKIDCPSNLLVLSDSLRLKQILLNLGRNSSKFMELGIIRFRAYNGSEGLIEISVEDQGVGIPVEKQGHLFERFQASLDAVSTGTGLGLSLCKHLTSLLGAEIFLDSNYKSDKPGFPGARFVIRLNKPALSARDLLEHSHSFRGELQARPSLLEELPEQLSVLFCDDDTILRKLFVRSVRKISPNWIIQEAASGESALELLKESKYDVIFLDNYMSSTQKILLGTETAREMRHRGVTSAICGLSANDLSDDFLENGADYFLMKKLLREEFAKLVHMRDLRVQGGAADP